MADELGRLGRRNRQLREQAHDAMYRDETGTSSTCRDCGVRFAAKPWYRVRTVGHNIPLARVLEGETRDLVKYDQCAGCNAEQGTRTPEEWRADVRAGGTEPVVGITDEQKRLGDRARWESYQRNHPSRMFGGRSMPDYLLSHEETYRLAVRTAEYTVRSFEEEIARREAELRKEERLIEDLRMAPATRKYLFGLVTVRDEETIAKTAASLKVHEQSLTDAHRRLDQRRLHLPGARDYLTSLQRDGRLLVCPCVACSGDYDERAARYREDWEAARAQRPWAREPSPFGGLRRRQTRRAPVPQPVQWDPVVLEPPTTGWLCPEHKKAVDATSPKGRAYRFCPSCGEIQRAGAAESPPPSDITSEPAPH